MAGLFSPAVYRAYNLDLQHLSDEGLVAHFQRMKSERRIFAETSNTIEFLSMRWLRGEGLEIGAGSTPIPLFGDAKVLQADCDSSLAFGGKSLDLVRSIDDPKFPSGNEGRFCFSVASHVLEHADSFLRALENLMKVTQAGGFVYVVLPDIHFLHDKTWLPYFEFDHHIAEYDDPDRYAKEHDELFLKGCGEAQIPEVGHAKFSSEYRAEVAAGRILPRYRFLQHKHNYRFDGWLDMMSRAQAFLKRGFSFADVRYGHERSDCHFVLEVTR